MLWLAIVFVVLGIIALVGASELVVRAGSVIGRRFGLSPLWIGLTIVALGTSAPELVVSVFGALDGRGDIVMGNVVGSNITNILVVLGITALVSPVPVAHQTVHRDIPFVSIVGFGLMAAAWSGYVPRWAGLLLLGAAVGYTIYLGKREQGLPEVHEKDLGVFWTIALLIAGLAGLLIGGRLVLSGAVDIAEAIGLSERVIGLTVVAIGTSLPELAISIAAAQKGKVDLAIGNLVGSNLLNMTLVLGTAVTVAPLDVSVSVARIDLPAMIGVGLLLWRFAYTDYRISRPEGALFLFAYVAYLAILFS